MCEELKKELEEGEKIAKMLAEHLQRMNAEKVTIPVILSGSKYEITATFIS